MNFIFFFPDELRADALGCYGNSITRTPHFDAFAKESVLFEQCHVQNPVCSPSRCSLVTGRYVHNDGHRTLWNLIKTHEENLFSYLKNAGYDIHIYGKNDVLSQDSVELYTDEFISHKELAKKTSALSDFGTDGYYNFLHKPMDDSEESLIGDYRNVEAGIQFIKNRNNTDNPFLLFLPLSFPHCPYTAPYTYYNMYMNQLDNFTLKEIGQNKASFQDLLRTYRKLDTQQAKKIRAVYSSMVSYTDMLFGRLLEAIKNSSLENDTTIIVAADHGDYAGDYGLVEKWPSGFEDALTHVPLLIKAPQRQEGHRVSEQVELFDIMPTILELASIETKHTHFAKSLVDQLNGKEGNKERIVYCEGGYNQNEAHCSEGTDKPSVEWMKDPKNIYYPKYLQQKEHPISVCRGVMARTLTHKLVRRSDGKHEFYDLVKDPDELYNVYDKEIYEAEQKTLEKALLDWYLNTSDTVPLAEDKRLNLSKKKEQ